MTVTDPWAAAQAPQYQPRPAGYYDDPATNGDTPQASSFASSYAPEPAGKSQLFSGQGESLPALFNKTHAPGTEFKGTILTAPRDVQSTSYPRNPGDPRLPQFWCTGPDGKRKPGPDAIDPRTGKPNDKVMDTVIEIQTENRLTPEERATTGRADYEDDGRRVWQVSGSKKRTGPLGQPTNAMRAMLDAIELAVKAGIPIVDDDSFVGLGIAVRRVERVQPGVSTSPWTYVAKIFKA